ncbi:MAG: CHAT domain-containing protein [Alphaproteobacteria bacterium]|nr:CHAT domain-containing protein [Alphaproteobacteria bacterium]
MTAFIYGDRNSVRSKEATFAHFVEVCGMLTIYDRKKKRETFDLTDALCKALGWYFPLLAKLRVRSVEALVFRKFPNVCPYCRQRPHQETICKQVKGTAKTLNHADVMELFRQNWSSRPATLGDWQRMFAAIYPRNINDSGRSSLGLMEELGEFAEAIRVAEVHPKFFLGEAADIFSYLMGMANEHEMREVQDDRTFSFDQEFLKRYPGLCMQCGSQICVCPAIPRATIGRMAKELAIGPDEKPFIEDLTDFSDTGKKTAEKALESVGGYPGLASRLPFDRGDANHALVQLCLKMASVVETMNPTLSASLRAEALRLGEVTREAGTASSALDLGEFLQRLRSEWKMLDEEARKEITATGGLVGNLGEMLNGLRVLFVLSNPDSDLLLRLHVEQRTIKEAIGKTGHSGQITLTDLPAAQVDDLRSTLLKGEFDVVHFSGHANAENLIFHGEGDNYAEVSLTSLAQLIAQYPSIKCVILNACESIKSITTAISPITIGMDEAISDQAAIAFSRGFYDALATGKSFERAFAEGKTSVQLAQHDGEMIRLIKKTDA